MISDKQFQIALDNCAKEPIHLSGNIQPHGFLLVLSDPDLEIVGISQNLLESMGMDSEEVLHKKLNILFDKFDAEFLENMILSQAEELREDLL